MKKYFPIPQLSGVVKDYHQRIIPDNKCSDCLNVMFKKGRIVNRWGYGQFGQQLNGAITEIAYYERLRTRQNDIVAFTATDTYKYNKATGLWEMITYSYNTGTVTTSGGTSGSHTTVTVTTGSFSSLFDGHSALFIGFGSTDMNDITTWYPVTWTSVSVLTGAGLPNATASSYVLRACWQGGETDHHSVAFPYYDDGSSWADNIMMVTNGVDRPQWWNGTGVMQEMYRSVSTTADWASGVDILTDIPEDDVMNIAIGDSITGTGMPTNGTVIAILSTTSIQLSGVTTTTGTDGNITIIGVQPNPAKHVAFFGSVGFEHTILANTVDNVYENIQTLEYSRAGNPFMWEGNYDDLLDSNDEILGVVPLETRLIVYKRYNLSVLMPNLNPTASDFFIINENAKRNIGTTSIRTVKNLGNYHIFMGWDDIYIYDGINVTGIGNDIINFLINNMNRSAMENSFAIDIDEEKLYCLFVPIGEGQDNPNYCFCFNYQEKHWTIWQLHDEMTAYGFFAKYTDAKTYGEMIMLTTGTFTSGSNSVAVADITGLEVGMSVFTYTAASDGYDAAFAAGYNDDILPEPAMVGTDPEVCDPVAKIRSITAGSGTAGTVVLQYADGTPCNAASGASDYTDVRLKIGWAYEDLHQRYRDMIVRANFNSYLIGDASGNIYEMSSEFFDDNGTEIQAFIETGDYDVNDPRHTFRLNETILGFIRQDEGYFKIYVSPDMGAHWSDPQLIPMFQDWINGGAENDYIEYLNNWTWRGTMMRIKVVNRDASNYYCPFEIESLLLGYTEDGGIRR